MTEPDFLKNPMEKIAALLRVAFDPEAAIEARHAACEQMKRLSQSALRKLASDEDWRYILNVLAGDTLDATIPGDGPWSENPDSWRGPQPQPNYTARLAQPPILDLYTQDLRWLMRDDYRLRPFVIAGRPEPLATPSDRVAASTAVTAASLTASEEVVRRLPWAMVNHGAMLLTLWETWPERPGLIRAFLEESIREGAELGIPPRLALRIESLLSESPGLQAWFDTVATQIDRFVAVEALDFLSVEELADRHLALRLSVARAVRDAEITNATIISAAELYATVRLLRAAAGKDVLRVWHEGGGNALAAVRIYDAMCKRNECFYDRAYRGVLRQPMYSSIIRLSDGERQALAFVRELRLRADQNSGFLSPGDLLL